MDFRHLAGQAGSALINGNIELKREITLGNLFNEMKDLHNPRYPASARTQETTSRAGDVVFLHIGGHDVPPTVVW